MLTNTESHREQLRREDEAYEREQYFADLHDAFIELYEAGDFRAIAKDGCNLYSILDAGVDGWDDVCAALMSDEARDALVKKCIYLHCTR